MPVPPVEMDFLEPTGLRESVVLMAETETGENLDDLVSLVRLALTDKMVLMDELVPREPLAEMEARETEECPVPLDSREIEELLERPEPRVTLSEEWMERKELLDDRESLADQEKKETLVSLAELETVDLLD